MSKAVERAQVRVETRNFDIRKNLLKYDDVMNDQRKTIFEQRMEFLTDDDVSDVIEDFRHQVCEDLIEVHVPKKAYAEQWDIEGLDNKTKQLMRISVPFDEWAKEEGIADEEMLERLKNSTDIMYKELTSGLAPEDTSTGPSTASHNERGAARPDGYDDRCRHGGHWNGGCGLSAKRRGRHHARRSRRRFA